MPSSAVSGTFFENGEFRKTGLLRDDLDAENLEVAVNLVDRVSGAVFDTLLLPDLLSN